MRTTIDLPDELYREVKSRAALQGVSMREYVIEALRAPTPAGSNKKHRKPKKSPFPLVQLKHTKVFDLKDFNFDDVLS